MLQIMCRQWAKDEKSRFPLEEIHQQKNDLSFMVNDFLISRPLCFSLVSLERRGDKI